MHTALVIVLSVIGGILFLWLVVVRIFRKLRPFPIPWRAALLLNNALRRRVQRPGRTLEQMGIGKGMRVLELGPGSGFFTPEAARCVGDSGRLCCVDVEPELVSRLRRKVGRAGLSNVDLIVGDGQHLPLKDGCLDLAYLVGVLGEIPDEDKALRELHRVLGCNGVLSILEMLVDPDYSLSRTIIARAGRAGFELFQKHGNVFIYNDNFRKKVA